MPSGKQTSFQFGEITEDLQYNSDTPFYSRALAKLSNGCVRKTGGVSNRPGTIHWINAEYQKRLTKKGRSLGSRIFGFSPTNRNPVLIEVKRYINIGDDGLSYLKAYAFTGYQSTPTPYEILHVDGDTSPEEIELNLEEAYFTATDNECIICVPIYSGVYDGPSINFFIFFDPENPGILVYRLKISPPAYLGTPSAAPISISCFGLAPQGIPVSYLITQEQDDGAEVFWQLLKSSICHPHADNATTLSDLDLDDIEGVKQYNVYRSAGGSDASDNGSHFALVGRVPPSSTSATFRDFLVSPDITVQPPTDLDLYPPEGYIRKIFFYKSRAVISYEPYTKAGADIETYSYGQLGVSKLGCSRMLGRPLTPNEIDAFTFNTPKTSVSKIVQGLTMQRLVLFTAESMIIVRGGDAGIFTASTVNPEEVYFEGSTEKVAPVSTGTRGYFINNNRSKLLMINFVADDSVSVIDISGQSSHLFEPRDIRRMAILKGLESVLWILKEDGTLISVTVSEDGTIAGYGRHKTKGYIEDISVIKALYDKIYTEKDFNENVIEILAMSVIRDGVRNYELMPPRDDVRPHRFLYADNCKVFGQYDFSINSVYTLNLTTATTFEGGEVITIEDTQANGFLSTTFTVGTRLDYFFPKGGSLIDEDGNDVDPRSDKIRFTITEVVSANIIKGTAERDIPEFLQDIDSQSLTTEEKEDRMGNFLQATNSRTGLTWLAGKDVCMYADGSLIASPLNEDMEKLTVALDGSITFPDYFNWGYIGLPYEFLAETLNLEAADQRTFSDTGKLINSTGVAVKRTQNGYIGQYADGDFESLEIMTDRQSEDMSDNSLPITGYRKIIFPAEWNNSGKICVRQIDPLPITLLAVYPKGQIGGN